jgi:hypothetical protein
MRAAAPHLPPAALPGRAKMYSTILAARAA